ncbi:hypothetical protein [Trueperella sp. LYQ141]|uniref:hypothetical protein n=1 Tax=Trueperella sp. LYQ141 TaxID=3391058 RepID=UPI0039838798
MLTYSLPRIDKLIFSCRRLVYSRQALLAEHSVQELLSVFRADLYQHSLQVVPSVFFVVILTDVPCAPCRSVLRGFLTDPAHAHIYLLLLATPQSRL